MTSQMKGTQVCAIQMMNKKQPNFWLIFGNSNIIILDEGCKTVLFRGTKKRHNSILFDGKGGGGATVVSFYCKKYNFIIFYPYLWETIMLGRNVLIYLMKSESFKYVN